MFLPTHSLPYLALLGVEALAASVSQTLTVGNADISPDGFTRSASLVNGAFPAPLITGNTGDNFQLNVVNNLDDSTLDLVTTVHWHGLSQAGTNEMDGVDMVTQCPIIPGNSFLYNFTVPDQAGTYWYHSHYHNQYCDGVRGALVVYDPSDPQADLYDIDDASTVITLADWYHFAGPQAAAVNTANSTLINGKGRYSDDFGSDLSAELAVITVNSGSRYRMRLISISCDPNFEFSIDGHQLTIIEVEGVNVQPLVVDQIQIYAGQRYSFILSADQDADNYWIRALPNIANATYDNGLNSAILRYNGSDEVEPTTSSSVSLPLVETDLHPLVSMPVPGTAGVGNADINLELDLAFTGTAFTINGDQFISPSVPVLLQILSGNTSATSLLPSGSVYYLDRNQTVEITIPGGAAGSPHPFHLHGHNFWVVRSSGNGTYNYEDPVVRDVVNTGDTGDSVTLRFTTDNPGPWFLHCHIDFHLNLGLAVVMAEAPTDVAANEEGGSPTSAWEALCPAYNDYIGA
uniref:Laccase B n=1 Tax=Peniophora lycii TaxID=154539 RepID=A0A2S0X9L1_9AGAM|nr:laccase B [Peniophora lycii]